MLLKYTLLLLGLVVGFQSKEICNFEENFCDWVRIYGCQFIHETKKPLAGEMGYLFLSENTCEKAGISFSTEKNLHKFQLHYFINGTGRGMLAVSVDYWFSGTKYLWSCDINQGPHWNKADIYVKKEGSFDWMTHINIEATVSGEMTVAIGNISDTYTGHSMSTCLRPRVTHKPKTQVTDKPESRKTTTIIPKTTSNVITSSASQETHHFTKRATVTSQERRKSTGRRLGTSYIPTTLEQTSKQSYHKDTTAIPAVTTTARNPPSSKGPQRPTPPQDVTTLKPGSSEIDVAIPGKSVKQRRATPTHGAIIGGTVFAVIFVIVAVVIGIFIYKRKNKMWNVQSSTAKGLENPMYQ